VARVKRIMKAHNQYEKYLAFRGHPRCRNRVATCVIVIKNRVEDRMDVIAAIRSPVPISFAIWASSAATVLLEGLFKGAPIRRSSLSLREKFTRQTSVCIPTLWLLFLLLFSYFFSSSSFFARCRFYARLLLVLWIRRSAASRQVLPPEQEGSSRDILARLRFAKQSISYIFDDSQG